MKARILAASLMPLAASTPEDTSTAAGRTRQAHWVVDLDNRTVTAKDDEARWISDEDADPEPTRGRARLVSVKSSVYDLEADGSFDEGSIDETHALGVLTHLDDRFDGHRGRAEVGQDDDAAALALHGLQGGLEGRLHKVVGGADAAVLRAPGGLEVHVGSHLGGQFTDSSGQGGRVGDDEIRNAHAHAAPASPAARTAARRMREVDTAPGSRCPMERSPR